MEEYRCVETGESVKAKNYKEAADKMFKCTYYQCPKSDFTIPTVYAEPDFHGSCIVKVYKPGDKQGSYWGVQAATPQKYTLKRL